MDWDTRISIYTDGFKLDKRVGIFLAKFDTRVAFRLPDHCRVFEAQITAINENLLALTKSVLTIKIIFILYIQPICFETTKVS